MHSEPSTHLFQRMVTVICLARTARGIYHHDVEHTIAAELVESFLSDRLLRIIRKSAKRSSATAWAGLGDEGGVQEPAGTAD